MGKRKSDHEVLHAYPSPDLKWADSFLESMAARLTVAVFSSMSCLQAAIGGQMGETRAGDRSCSFPLALVYLHKSKSFVDARSEISSLQVPFIVPT